MAEKAELVITALQQRIGEIVSNYETQIAFLRAEITNLMEEKKEKANAIQAYEEHLDNITGD
jgi:restriction endonuclease S subunit